MESEKLGEVSYPDVEPKLTQIDPILFKGTHKDLPNEYYKNQANSKINPNELPSVDLIHRMVAQYGNFNQITQESLLAKNEDIDDPMGDDEDSAEKDQLKTYIEETIHQREIMIGRIHQAVNSANIASDLISLIVSKVKPNASQSTMSNFLKQNVKLGSMSYSITNKSEEKSEEEQEGEQIHQMMISRGWKLKALEKISKIILNSSEEMEQRIANDKIYWDDMIDIVQSGEVITMNNQRDIIVKYGYGDSGSVYYDKGIGLLKRGKDGHIIFEKINNTEKDNVWSSDSVCHLKIYRSNGELCGESNSFGFVQKNVPSKSDELIGSKKVLNEINRSRFTLFENELYWHLIKEASSLISLNVQLEDGENDMLEIQSKIKFHLPSVTLGDLTIEISKAKLDDIPKIEQMPENDRADQLMLLFRMLICQSHKRNLDLRRVPPMAMSSKIKPVMNEREKYGFLIRPLIIYSRHLIAIDDIKNMLQSYSSDVQIDSSTDDTFQILSEEEYNPITKLSVEVGGKVKIEVAITSIYRTANFVYSLKVLYLSDERKDPLSLNFTDHKEMDDCIKWVLQS